MTNSVVRGDQIRHRFWNEIQRYNRLHAVAGCDSSWETTNIKFDAGRMCCRPLLSSCLEKEASSLLRDHGPFLCLAHLIPCNDHTVCPEPDPKNPKPMQMQPPNPRLDQCFLYPSQTTSLSHRELYSLKPPSPSAVPSYSQSSPLPSLASPDRKSTRLNSS